MHTSRVPLAVPRCVPPLPTGCGTSSAVYEESEEVRDRPPLKLGVCFDLLLNASHAPCVLVCLCACVRSKAVNEASAQARASARALPGPAPSANLPCWAMVDGSRCRPRCAPSSSLHVAWFVAVGVCGASRPSHARTNGHGGCRRKRQHGQTCMQRARRRVGHARPLGSAAASAPRLLRQPVVAAARS